MDSGLLPETTLIEIAGEGGADRVGHQRDMAVIRVVEAGHDWGSADVAIASAEMSRASQSGLAQAKFVAANAKKDARP